jgi:nucleotide-binding universal stress UspA family protein
MLRRCRTGAAGVLTLIKWCRRADARMARPACKTRRCLRVPSAAGLPQPEDVMTIRVALVPLTDDAGDEPALDAALAVLRRAGASSGGGHVRALHVRAQPSAAVFAGTPEGTMVTAEILTLWERDAKERAARARARYVRWRDGAKLEEATASGRGPAPDAITASWAEREGQLDPVIGQAGRLADLVVIGAPAEPGRDGSFYPYEGALFDSRRPALLVPRALPATAFDTILIGWNGSAEAAAAIAGALPLLARAKTVAVFVAGEKGEEPEAPRDLLDYLRWHNIAATQRLIKAPSHNVGAELAAEAGRIGAGLIVMGAYTHSRVRELIFGGATNHVLKNSSVALFMAH